MKLIDLLVKELPHHGGWPDRAKIAYQSGVDLEIYFDDGSDKNPAGFRFFAEVRASDCQFGSGTFVTRDEYEAAIAKNDGWIEWGGGGCPVPQGTLVDVRYRCGKENHHVKAGIFGDDSGSDPEHHAGYWGGYNSQWDIIAYRLHRDINSLANDDRLEQDLNECIGQDVVPACNGEGLPPSGTKCQVKWAGGKWEDCEVLFMGVEKAFVKIQGREATFSLCDVEFRPLRTEAEKARELGIKLMLNCVTNYNKTDVIHAIEQLYDAGYRKEVK